MKKLVNFMLLASLIILMAAGGLIYAAYKKSQAAESSLLLVDTNQYEQSVKIKEGSLEDETVSIIYYLSDEDHSLQEIVLAISNTKKQTLGYISIPSDTKVEISKELYQKLSAISAKLPQYFKASTITELFDKKNWYSYGQLILDEEVGMDSSCYLVMYGTESTLKEHIATLRNYVQSDEWTTDVKSNLSKKEKKKLVEYLVEQDPDNAVYEIAHGEQHTDYYELNSSELGIQIDQLQNKTVE